MQLRRLIRKTQLSFDLMLDLIDYARTKVVSFSKPNYIRKRWGGAVKINKATRVVVFNHFDSHGLIHDYVMHYLNEMVKSGFAIIFTSNSPKFPEESIEKLKPLVAEIIWRSNVGYDFGAFKDGVAAIPDVEKLDKLLITNDSVYGPLQSFDQILIKSDADQADLWGVTDSWERRYHLQSYFLLFHPQALRNPGFKKFWNGVQYYRRKNLVVRYGEIGLTHSMQRHGVRCKALHEYRRLQSEITEKIEATLKKNNDNKNILESVQKEHLERLLCAFRNGTPLNQTHFFWDYLLTHDRCAFIKRDLLHGNPMGFQNLHNWEKMLQKNSTYDTNLIIHHMQQKLRNRVY